jgi:hypothetical protein
MKRRNFLASLAALVAAPKALLAMKPAPIVSQPADVPMEQVIQDILDDSFGPDAPRLLPYHNGDYMNVADMGGVNWMPDLSGNGNSLLHR